MHIYAKKTNGKTKTKTNGLKKENNNSKHEPGA
jgi:hypothetical protein